MVAQTRPATLDDLDATPDDGRVYELLNGEIVVSPAPLPKHQSTVLALARLLDRWVEEHDLGDMYLAPTDIVLSNGNALQPDLFFIATENLIEFVGSRLHGVPDLAVEVISPSSRTRDATEKAVRYAREGVPEYWLVDPQYRSITLFTLRDGAYSARPVEGDGTLMSGVIDGLRVDPDAIFRRVDLAESRRRSRR